MMTEHPDRPPREETPVKIDLERRFTHLAVEAGWLDQARLAEVEVDRLDSPETRLPDLLVQPGWLEPRQRAELEQRLSALAVDSTTFSQADWARTLRESIADVAVRGRFVLDSDEPPRQGGMGRVWLAHDDRLGRTVALKELRDDTRDVAELRQRFLVEAQITAQLQHPGIAPVYELVRPDDGAAPFYTMRFVEGQTLTEAVREFHARHRQGQDGTLELRELLLAFVSVCNTLAYAHARGVVHRDLKGSNVMLGRYGEVVVLDWGLARVLGVKDPGVVGPAVALLVEHEQTHPGAVGTPSYMAPEQARGELECIDRRSDVFGLGAVLYEILTGQPPYRGPDTVAVLVQAAEGKPRPPRQVAAWLPRPLEAVCLKALAAQPEERYQSAAELADEVKRWLAGEPVKTWPEPLAVRAGRWLRKNRVLAASTAAGLLVALLLSSAAAAWWHQERRARGARQQQAGREGREALKEAVPLRKQMRWKQAKVLLDRARGAIAESSDPGLAQDLRQAEADLKLAWDLDRVREEADAQVDGLWNPGRVKERYPQVFTKNGLNILEGSVEPLAQRIGASAVRDEVLAALDHWAQYADRETQRRLLELTWRVDSKHPWRKQLLDPEFWRNAERRRALLKQLERERLTPATAVFLFVMQGRGRAEAQPLLERARERNPGDFWLNMTLANHLAVPKERYVEERDRGRQEEAIGYFRAALAVKPDSAVAHNNLGKALYDKGDAERALRSFQAVIHLDPRYAKAHHNLGNALAAMGDLDRAIRAYREAIRLEPTLPHAHNHLGVVLRSKKDPKGAIHHIEEAIRLDPRMAAAHGNLGAVLADRGNVEGAIRCYKETIRLEPTSAWAHNNLGLALAASKNMKGAIRHFEEAIRLDPRLAQAHYNLGLTLALVGQDRGDLEGAIRSYREAIRLDPKHANAHYNLGLALAGKDMEGAIRHFKEAIRLDPTSAEAHRNLGIALNARGGTKEAIRCCKEAIRLDPTSARAHDNLGVALRARGNLEGAIRSFQESVRLDPRDAKVHTNLGVALSDKKDYEGAIRSYREAIRLDPTLPTVHTNLGVALDLGGQLEDAIRSYREAIRLDPRYTHAHAALGAALLKLGHFAEARNSLERASTLAPPGHRLSPFVANQIALCRQLLECEQLLNAVLAGKSYPQGPTVRVQLALIAQCPAKQHYTTAVRLYTEAFQMQPSLANDLPSGHRYNAACAAVLAGTGQGKDIAHLADPDRAEIRYRALGWLQDDLAVHASQLVRGPVVARRARQTLLHWQKDADLAAVRDPISLARLPEAEQVAWRNLWAQVDALLARPTTRK
jgi:tetratricopeptide (TPR) repeat protein/tRNA A-37 threonylcarbamoyl transferase component Bud32